jgi:hypothetical protein
LFFEGANLGNKLKVQGSFEFYISLLKRVNMLIELGLSRPKVGMLQPTAL